MKATLREISAVSLALILKMLIPSKIRTQIDKKKQFEFTNLRIYEFMNLQRIKIWLIILSFFCFSLRAQQFRQTLQTSGSESGRQKAMMVNGGSLLSKAVVKCLTCLCIQGLRTLFLFEPFYFKAQVEILA